MISLKWLPALVLLTVGSAHATSFVMTTDAFVSMSMSSTHGTSSSFRDDKIVLAAKTDAVAFVASDGAIRGAQLESAFQHIRTTLVDLHCTDDQLARAILTL